MRDSGPIATAGRAATSERRPLTILFADIAGSTTIAEKLDPEDWTVLVQRAFDHLNAVASRYGGTVARLMGGGVSVFFWATLAHVGAPQRAGGCGPDMVCESDQLAAAAPRYDET